MAAWLLQALRLLAVGAVGGAGWEAGQRIVGPVDPRTGSPELFAEARGWDWGDGGGIGGVIRGRRKRRRRALTYQDKDDIAFLAATVGEPTARKFALLLASKSR